MTTELDTIPFHGTDILTTQIDGEPYILLKPVFTAIGVNPDRQIAKIQKQPWATTAVKAVEVDGYLRKMVAANLKTFLMALATIQVGRVSENAQPLLIAYQAEVADVIEAYYAKGMAPINPRVQPDQVPAVVAQAVGDYRTAREKVIDEEKAELKAMAEVSAERAKLLNIALSGGHLDSEWGRTKMQVIVARGLGEAPAIAQKDVPLYIEDFMKSKGVVASKIGNFSGQFGKRVIAQAKADNVPVPGKRLREIGNGDVREITAWTKAHLPVFERAWAASYANDSRLFS